MKNKKNAIIIHLIITVLVIIFSILIYFNDDFSNTIAIKIFKHFKMADKEYIGVYVKIFALSCLVCTPKLLYTFDNFATAKIGWIFTCILLVGFYFFTKNLYSQIPIVKDDGTEYLWGVIPIFGWITSFFSNLCYVYLWYALPVIYSIVLYIIWTFIEYKSNNELKRLIIFIFLSALVIAGLPMLIMFLSIVLGQIIGFLVGVLLLGLAGFVMYISYKEEVNAPKNVFVLDNGDTVVQQYGNVYKDKLGNIWEKDGYDKFTKR